MPQKPRRSGPTWRTIISNSVILSTRLRGKSPSRTSSATSRAESSPPTYILSEQVGPRRMRWSAVGSHGRCHRCLAASPIHFSVSPIMYFICMTCTHHVPAILFFIRSWGVGGVPVAEPRRRRPAQLLCEPGRVRLHVVPLRAIRVGQARRGPRQFGLDAVLLERSALPDAARAGGQAARHRLSALSRRASGWAVVGPHCGPLVVADALPHFGGTRGCTDKAIPNLTSGHPKGPPPGGAASAKM
mmetsp:Transcript_30258/g.96558  ORF Transcript_30258/g.96558 Transcript_30258/m.96558 type:complete len:244 (+) Transcript_30258:644-1375(+)